MEGGVSKESPIDHLASYLAPYLGPTRASGAATYTNLHITLLSTFPLLDRDHCIIDRTLPNL